MTAAQEDNSWDFAPVYDLLQHFSISGDDHVIRKDYRASEREASGDSSSSPDQPVTPDEEASGTGLGNFDKIWEYLGQPFDIPPPIVAPLSNDSFLHSYGFDDGRKEPKIVKWRDEIDGADLADNDDAGDSLSLSGLTKTQRKKANRKHRKAIAEQCGPGTAAAAAIATSSENESEKEKRKERTPDSKGVIQRLLYGSFQTPDESPTIRRLRALRRSQLPLDTDAWAPPGSNAANGIYQASSRSTSTTYAVAAARKATLMTMLNEKFPDERQYLSSISILPHTNKDQDNIPEGLHVFIDASNIMIGFHDALKASHSLPKDHRMRRQPISFHSLSLILTRGRPSSKLVLAGSDNFPAIVEAKSLGYETSILDRVHKAKELTPRQKLFSKSGSGGQSAGSGSETGAAYADKKWVEQAVDEILHLKMMESVVDCVDPGVMVLASGDAAEAEYSGGFLKMVERALRKGWKVEVACFRQNTSGMYRRKEFREKWGRAFKLVELDDFVEVLLGAE